MESKSFFSLGDYDSIGFDLDCTVVEYNVKELMKLVYELLAEYLIEKRGYDSEFLLKSFEPEDFLQKGLFVDFKRGNILKLDDNGVILKASHGTFPLSNEKIQDIYGESRNSTASKEFIKDPLSDINSPQLKLLRATLDCFDRPVILLFARVIDHLDEKNGNKGEYCVWPDIVDGLYHLYSRDHFASEEGGFFSALKKNPGLYLKKWTPKKLAWLKDVKLKKFVFLLTGSFIDFASLTASYCIGEDWKDYFHVVVCYARKPYFFYVDRPFLHVDDGKEMEPVQEKTLEVNEVYSQGNWQELKALIVKQTKNKQPKCVYIGDNLIQDVYTPVHFNCCDSVAVLSELKEECGFSQLWDSFFDTKSFWNHLIRKHAMICVSGLDVFSNKPLDYKYCCLKLNETRLEECNGYYIN